jgi:hypothetical protein
METKDAQGEIVADIFAGPEPIYQQAITGGPQGPRTGSPHPGAIEEGRQGIRTKFGVQEIGVQIIGETRDGEHGDGDCPSHQRSSSRLQNRCV